VGGLLVASESFDIVLMDHLKMRSIIGMWYTEKNNAEDTRFVLTKIEESQSWLGNADWIYTLPIPAPEYHIQREDNTLQLYS